MGAIVQDVYGSADRLRLSQIDKPAIGVGEVLVQVRAAGVDRGTCHLMRGEPYLMRILGFGFRGPKQRVPGLDVAGTVAAAGADVRRFRPGDEVLGIARGSFAEYAAARADKLVRKPARLSFEQAAVVAVSGLAAIQGLHTGRIAAGQKVLIIGASGGVGTYAVQLAKAFGATVTGVASTGKVDLVRSIGADEVIDYTREDFADGRQHYDLILDIGGSSRLSRLRRERWCAAGAPVGVTGAVRSCQAIYDHAWSSACACVGRRVCRAGRGLAAEVSHGSPGVVAPRRQVLARRAAGVGPLRGRRAGGRPALGDPRFADGPDLDCPSSA
jgi:threonine dehydrogenase-like Zn-dependent dehydrogenase